MSDKKNSNSEIPAPTIPKNRLETLTDGIFAIAMTLLVLSIEIPTFPSNPNSAMLMEYVLYNLLPQISVYVLSFILLASFWMTHHVFFAIKSVNIKLIWINIFWLMAIAIVPFSTNMVGKYGEFQLSQIIFCLNMLIIGILFYVNWTYSVKEGLIYEKVLPHKERIRKSFLYIPILSILALIISFIIPYGSIFVFLVIPTFFRFVYKLKSSKS